MTKDELNKPIPIKRLFSVGIPWLCDKIAHHSNYPRCVDSEGKPWNYNNWVIWALEHGFVYLWPDPPTLGLIARPITREMVYGHSEYPESDLLYIFDQDGDGLWVDFLWAPGQWNIVMSFLRATGKRWVGWEHKTTAKPHIRTINQYCDLHRTVDKEETPLMTYLNGRYAAK